jgi:CheY-like chemotaxis protein
MSAARPAVDDGVTVRRGSSWERQRAWQMIRILLVEHPEGVRRALSTRLALESDIVQVGEAGDAVQAERAAGALQPDVIVVDAEMPFLDLPRAVLVFRACSPSSRIVVLTQDTAAPDLTVLLHETGVSLVGKYEGPAALSPAIRSAVAERRYGRGARPPGGAPPRLADGSHQGSVGLARARDEGYPNLDPRASAGPTVDAQAPADGLRSFSHRA